MSTTVSTTLALVLGAPASLPAATAPVVVGKVSCAHSVLICAAVSEPPDQDSRPKPKEFDAARMCPV